MLINQKDQLLKETEANLNKTEKNNAELN